MEKGESKRWTTLKSEYLVKRPWLTARRRYGLGIDSVELCAGVAEPGETPEQSARRELQEETGYGGGKWTKLMEISQNPGTCNNITHCFLAQGVECISSQHLDRT